MNFFLQPPSSQNPNGNGPGTIQGVVFTNLNNNHTQELGEPGVQNFRVFIDANLNGVWDSATETSVLTGANGSFFFANVQPGIYRIDVAIPNEGDAERCLVHLHSDGRLSRRATPGWRHDYRRHVWPH